MSSSLGNVIALVLVASLPVVLSGAMSTEMRSDIGFQDTDLGLAVTSYYIAAASLSVAGGRLAERWGPSWSARGAALLATSACFAIGSADRLAALFPALVLGGASIALAQPTAIAVIVRHVPSVNAEGWRSASSNRQYPVPLLLLASRLPPSRSRSGGDGPSCRLR